MKPTEDKKLKEQLKSVYTIAHFGKRFLSPPDIRQITDILELDGYHKDNS